MLFAVATSVSKIKLHLLKHLFSHGVGLSNRGLGCIWTLLARCSNACFLWWWMHTPNGLKCFLCPTLHHLAPFNNFKSSLLSLVFLVLSMVPASQVKSFRNSNGIHRICSSPYHPASNELTERAVHVFKEGLKKMKVGTISDKIARFLFSYRNIQHSSTGVLPAEQMFG